MIKKPPPPRYELQAHLIATKINLESANHTSAREVRTEGPEDIMAIIERELARIQADKKGS